MLRTLAALAWLLSASFDPPPVTAFERIEDRVPCVEYSPLRRPFFGDLHVHTRYSLDANTQGTRTTPLQAYAFARGKALGIQPWNSKGQAARTVQLDRPLDFAAVTDHAELFGETTICATPGMPGHDSFMCRLYRGWPRLAFFMMNSRRTPFAFCGEEQAYCNATDRLVWQTMRDAAEAAYDRTPDCSFTSFIGYEWTGYTHRNVIFRGADTPDFAPSSIEYPHETHLWDALDKTCREDLASCDFVVVPHNSNVSNSTSFHTTNLDSTPMSAATARRRALNEPLVEIMQHKGSSECYRGVGTTDELCDFENVPYGDLVARFATWLRVEPAPIDFTRTALGVGLLEQSRIGVNPFHFGFIGSTDTHLGTPGLTEEVDYPGHGGAGVPVGDTLPDLLLDPIEYNPGGLAVLWAEENSRDALYSAMQRKEAYGTSGPRIVLRMFGGWDYPEDLCERSDFAATGYADGVPMGSNLLGDSRGRAPVFAVRAIKDSGTPGSPGIPLQRMQIIKLWVDGDEVRETIADIAGETDSAATVDTGTCTPSTTGANQLCTVWRDPGFDPAVPAVYYARVVQDPTCRWSTRMCNRAGIRCDQPGSIRRGWEDCCNSNFPKIVQERAWTSPIWYDPAP